jgi:hypothetical protein
MTWSNMGDDMEQHGKWHGATWEMTWSNMGNDMEQHGNDMEQHGE